MTNPIAQAWRWSKDRVAAFAAGALAPPSNVLGGSLGYGAGVADIADAPVNVEAVATGASWTGIGARNLQILGHGRNSRDERFDPAVIEAMLEDPAVSASVSTRVLKVLCGKLTFHPSVEDDPADPGKGDPKLARWAAEFCERAHRNLETPIPVWAWGFLRDGLTGGHKVAEKVLEEIADGRDAGLYTLKALKIKAGWSYHLCADPFYNLLAVWANTVWGPAYIDARHFLVFSNCALDSDPRGTTILRPAKEAWRRKQRRLQSQSKGDDQFGSPSIKMVLPPNAPIESGRPGPNGRPLSTVEAAKLTLEEFQNGSSIAVSHGTEVDVLESGRDGSQLVNSIRYDDQEIVRSILFTTVGVLEPEHYTQGTGDQAEGKQRDMADFDRDAFLAVIRRQVFHYLLEENKGKAFADTYTPELRMGAIEVDEFLKLATPISTMAQSGAMYGSWLTHLMVLAGFPRPRKGELRIGPSGPIPDTLTEPSGSVETSEGKTETFPTTAPAGEEAA